MVRSVRMVARCTKYLLGKNVLMSADHDIRQLVCSHRYHINQVLLCLHKDTAQHLRRLDFFFHKTELLN